MKSYVPTELIRNSYFQVPYHSYPLQSIYWWLLLLSQGAEYLWEGSIFAQQEKTFA